ncbi:hypothetical protein PIB30_045007 [Stylosanthes scabra]|uniref:Uncharacterized protein n=1 Tax=Stylosanthes scabra TaxID=79078 RepID=A0ABU6YEP7_9FABA|nr:hypothetical protein [Stylosanthes scabra]
MAAEGSGPGRNLSMEIDEMKDKMECMVELQSPMNIPTAQGGIPIGGTVNGLNLNQFTMPVGEGYQPVDRVHTEVPAQVIDNASGSHTESGKDKVKEEWMEKIQEQIHSIQGTNIYGRVEIEQLCPSLDILLHQNDNLVERGEISYQLLS